MYINCYDLYFGEKDYLHFDSIEFICENKNNYEFTNDHIFVIIPRICYDNEKSRYMIRIEFHYDYMPSAGLISGLLVSKDEQRNKMSILCNLRKIMLLIYDTVRLCKKYMNITKFDTSSLSNIFIKVEKHKLKNNLIIQRKHNIEIFVDIDNFDVYNNATLIAIYSGVVWSTNKVTINGNIVDLRHAIIIYPDSYNYCLSKELPRALEFYLNPDTVCIEKSIDTFRVNYYTPLPTLTKFVDNIELFNDVDNICINNEYDLLKYI